MSTTFVTKDSGQREQFDTGCRRDTRTGKGRYDLIPTLLEKRLAELYERGAIKYDSNNWRKGMPISRCIDSAKRHLNQFIDGDTVEDHLSAVVFNIACMMYYLDAIERGVLPPELDDRWKTVKQEK